MARRLRDQATLALAIHSRRYAQWGPDNFEQRLADAAQCRTLAFEANELELAVSASRWRFTDLLEDGDVAAADRELDSHAELAERLHQPFLLAYTTQFRALRAIMQGRFADGEALADEARVQAQRAGNPLAGTVYGPQMFPVWRQRGEHEQLDAFLRTALRSAPPHPATTSAMALIHAELGERETAAAMVEQLAAPGFGKFRHDMLFLPGLTHLTLVLRRARRLDATPRRSTTCCGRTPAASSSSVRRRRRAGGRSTTISACSPRSATGPTGRPTTSRRPSSSAPGSARRRCSPRRASSSASLLPRRGRGRTSRPGDGAARRGAANGVGARAAADDRAPRRHRRAPTATAPPQLRRRRPPRSSDNAACSLRRDGEFWTVITPRRQHPRARRQGSAPSRHVARPSRAGRSTSSTSPEATAAVQGLVGTARRRAGGRSSVSSRASATPARCSTTPPRTPIAGASPSSTS